MGEVMNTDQIVKQMIMSEAERRFTEISEAVAQARLEVEKDITIHYLDPGKLRERISEN